MKIKNNNYDCIHSGENRFKENDSLTVPIYRTSTFVFKDAKDVADYTKKGKDRFEYNRYGNPTQRVCEKRMAFMEGTDDAVMTASGMNAIVTTLMTFLKSGDHVIATDDLYKKTYQFLNIYMRGFGVEVDFVNPDSISNIAKKIKSNTKIIFSESPTNPYLNIIDIPALAKLCRKKNILSIIDSTFATPYNINPAKFGIDIVIHSITKYLAGHNDILGGVVCSNGILIEQIKNFHKINGGIMDSEVSYMFLRGLKTFNIRMEKISQSAIKVAKYLENHKKIKRVYYPHLRSHPHYKIAKKNLKTGAGVVTFEIDAKLSRINRFFKELKLIYIGPSFGGVESLITHPASISYYDMSRKERYQLGMTDELVRLSVGIEDVDAIISDIDNALKKV